MSPVGAPEVGVVESGNRPPVVEPHLYLLMEMEAEAARWRRRSMFLLSIILHALLALILALSPELSMRGKRLLGIVPLTRKPTDQSTFLYLPPDLQKPPKIAPLTPNLSDKNRIARGRSPVVDPNGLKMPYLKGNTKLPEIAGGGQPTPKPAPPSPPPAPAPKPPESAGTSKSPPQGGNPTPPESKPEVAQLHLENVPAAPKPGAAGRLNLSEGTPGDNIEQSRRSAARGRATGGIPGPGDSNSQLNNLNSNFDIPGYQILSDTRGVDFGPYLARVIYVIKQNWYSVMPESARLGEKGQVAIEFSIMKDGKVTGLQLVGSSGADPLDRAALSSINLSNPFSPLPAEFTGDHLTLRIIYLYNMGYGP